MGWRIVLQSSISWMLDIYLVSTRYLTTRNDMQIAKKNK